MTQLFSPDSALPHFSQPICVKQVGNTDCGLFSIAYAIDLLHGNNTTHKRLHTINVKCDNISFPVSKIEKFHPFQNIRLPVPLTQFRNFRMKQDQTKRGGFQNVNLNELKKN